MVIYRLQLTKDLAAVDAFQRRISRCKRGLNQISIKDA